MYICVCVCNYSSHIPNPAGVIGWEESGLEEEGRVRRGVSSFRRWLRVRGGRWWWGVCVHVCVTATDRFRETKLGLCCHKYRGEEGGRARQRKRGMNEQRGRVGGGRDRGREGGRWRRDEGLACSSLIPSNIPLDDRAWPKER